MRVGENSGEINPLKPAFQTKSQEEVQKTDNPKTSDLPKESGIATDFPIIMKNISQLPDYVPRVLQTVKKEIESKKNVYAVFGGGVNSAGLISSMIKGGIHGKG